jgi:prepilin-type N-terminal cleavage/methylation domain-containing protein
MKKRKAFTLIELLVVIAIIAVLSVVVILSLNPAELLRQSRDSNRVSDLATIKSAVSLYLVDSQSPNIASNSLGYSSCYLSTISGGAGTSTVKCGVFTNTYTTNGSSSQANYRKIDSTGWVPVNFSSLSYGSPFGALPVDPVNNTSSYYAYAATSSGGYYFEIDAFMESVKYAGEATVDGGNNNAAYEVGNQPGLTL